MTCNILWNDLIAAMTIMEGKSPNSASHKEQLVLPSLAPDADHWQVKQQIGHIE